MDVVPRSTRRGVLLGSAALGVAASAGVGPSPAVADDASADLVLTGSRTARTGPITGHGFSMVGLTWRGGPESADLHVRTRRDGEWSGWRALRPLHDGPDSGGEGHSDLRATEPVWTGACDAIDVRGTHEGLRALTLSLIDPGATPAFRGGLLERGQAKPTSSPKPDIVRREAWGANEKWRNGGPWFNRTIQQVHIHHTVNSNDYSRHEVPALLRGIYRYHTKTLGWSDVGYNFLVDRFGTIWQGRAGGSRRPVLGAHTLGFNSTSTGVAVIGNFDEARPTPETLKALVHLAAWKLDLYGREPGRRVGVWSHGSDRFASGEKVRLPVIDGHRDTNDTACPGRHLYRKLPSIRRRAHARVTRFDPKN